MRTDRGSTVVLFGLAACGAGGGSLEPGAGNDPGTGTHTLHLDGTARASARQVNAHQPTDFETEFTLGVSLDNHAVTTGAVTITSATGKISLTVRSDDRWTGSAPSYDEVYLVDVVSGSDVIAGLRVDGPDIHVFLEPTPGAPIDTARPLPIAWSRAELAELAMLRTDASDPISIPDTGSYSLAAGTIRADKAETLDHLLRLARTNRVTPAGTAAGSTWSVTVENQVNVRTMPQPPL